MYEIIKYLKETAPPKEGEFLRLGYAGAAAPSAADVIKQETYDNGIALAGFNPDIFRVLAIFPGDALVWITDEPAMAEVAKKRYNADVSKLSLGQNEGFLIGSHPEKGMLVLVLAPRKR